MKLENNSQLRDYLDTLFTKFDIKNLSYLPRWLVLLIDLGIIIFTFLLTYVMLAGFKMAFLRPDQLWYGMAGYLVINLVFIWVFKTYAGIIRFSSFIDGIKILLSQFSSFFVTVVVNYILLYTLIEKPFLTLGLFINFIFSFSFLFFYRIIVKQIFDNYFQPKSIDDLEGILIYGVDANALAVANSLNTEIPKRFKVKGFISQNKNDYSKRLLNLSIYDGHKKTSAIIRYAHAKSIILTDKNLTSTERSEIVEDCINHNYKVYNLPTMTNWDDAKSISKNIRKINILELLDRKEIILDKDNIKNQTTSKTILISGAAGSIGSEMARQVSLFKPKKIILLDQAESPLYDLHNELLNNFPDQHYVLIIADVRDQFLLEQVFKKYKPSIIYHAAAYKHVPLMEHNPKQAIMTNVLGTKNLADLAIKYQVDKFVMVSTDKAVNPSNVMGASKRIAELYVKALQENSDTKFITTRFGNVLGSNGSVVPLFTKQIENGGPITLTHPDIIRYFMTIPEACQLVLEAGAMGNGGEIYIFDMGKPVKIVDLAKKMIKLAGLIPEVDIKIEFVGLRPGEKLYEELLNDASTTLPTYHKKIMIVKEENFDTDFIKNGILDFYDLLKHEDDYDIISKMKALVPEYISMNSDFEKLDKPKL